MQWFPNSGVWEPAVSLNQSRVLVNLETDTDTQNVLSLRDSDTKPHEHIYT